MTAGSSSSITARSSRSSSRAACARRASTRRSIRRRARVEWIREWKPTGIILSGGPNSVYEDGRADAPTRRCSTSRPCSASATACSSSRTCSGGEVHRGGPARVRPRRDPRRRAARRCSTASTPDETTTVWMSHGDHVDAPPPGFVVTASSSGNPDRRDSSTSRTPDLRRAVSSRGRAHAARRRAHRELPLRRLQARRRAGRRARSSRSEVAKIRAAGRRRAGDLRALRRRGLVGRRGAGASRDRRSAHVRLRRHRTAAPARARAGRAHVPRATWGSSS